MKIEIKERCRDDESTSFDLVIDGKIKLKDSGISNCCEYLLSNYGKFARGEL